MRKTIFRAAMLVWMSLAVLPMNAEVLSGYCGSNVKWSLDTESGVLSITGTGKMKNYAIMSEAPWYVKRESIWNVIIENGVTSIGDYTFYKCSALTSVTIPESVTNIGTYAFYKCSALTSVTIPEGVTSIGASAFSYCSGLTSVTIPESVTSIGDGAFSYCSGLTSVTIPEGVKSIGASAFYGCSGLTSVTIPEGVTSIGSSAFSGCSGLLSPLYTRTHFIQLPEFHQGTYSIPEGITDIVGGAFSGCTGLTSVTIPEGVTSIGKSTFRGCTGLTSLTIPEGVTSIEYQAFKGCSKLTSVTIPESVTSIGQYAFYGCSNLTSVTIPEGVTSIENYAFSYCSGLTSVTIPEGVTSIGNYAFYDCTGLTSVTIPESVTSIGNYAFSGCNHLAKVYWDALTNFKMSEFPSIKEFIIGDNVKTIYSSDAAPKLEYITLGKSVEAIRANAFNCPNLKEVTCYAKEPPYCYPNAFTNIPSNVTLYVYKSSVEKYKAADQWKDFNIVGMPEGRETMMAELQSLYEEYSQCNFKAGTEIGQYGKEEVKAFNTALYTVSNIMVDDSDYTDEEIAEALEALKMAYGNVLASEVTEYRISDGVQMTIDETKTYSRLSYTRTFDNTDWQPLYVPFGMAYEDWAGDFEVARLNNVHQWDDNEDGTIDRTELEVIRVKSGNIEPNTPYLIRAKSIGDKVLTIKDATLYPTNENSIDCSSIDTKFTFMGTYKGMEASELSTSGYFTLNGNKLTNEATESL